MDHIVAIDNGEQTLPRRVEGVFADGRVLSLNLDYILSPSRSRCTCQRATYFRYDSPSIFRLALLQSPETLSPRASCQ